MNTDQTTEVTAVLATSFDASEQLPVTTDVEPPVEEIQPVEQLPKPFDFDKARPLNPAGFPNQSQGGNSILGTITNLEFLLHSYRIQTSYNVITKKLEICFAGMTTTIDNAEEVALNYIISLAILNNMSTANIAGFVATIADRNQINPVADWITSKEWDGIDRLPLYYATLTARDDFPVQLKEKLMYCWLLSAIAAALKSTGFRARGVITLQGKQGLGKSTWVKSHIPVQPLCDQVIKIDHNLDTHNKDSQITALSHLIVELGEIEGSLKKDIAKLKGFLTSDFDKLRRPYARTTSELPRRTVFAATVNEEQFLVDSTGNTRFWTIPVIAVDYNHNVDMQQVFAQLKVDFDNGVEWWLSKDYEELLESFNNANHRVVNVIQERVMNAIDVSRSNKSTLEALTASEVLNKIGIRFPTNQQAKDCAAVLRQLLGDSKRINGLNKWRVGFKQNQPFADDEYYN